MDTATRIIRVQGTPFRVPDGIFTLTPDENRPQCEAREPEWPDGTGGQVVCELPRHGTGPDGQAHIATNAGWPTGDIIAIWQEVPAIWNLDDEG